MALLGALSYFGRGCTEPKTRAERVGDGALRRRGPMVARDRSAAYALKASFQVQVAHPSLDLPCRRQLRLVAADPHLNEMLLHYCEQALAYRPLQRGPAGPRT